MGHARRVATVLLLLIAVAGPGWTEEPAVPGPQDWLAWRLASGDPWVDGAVVPFLLAPPDVCVLPAMGLADVGVRGADGKDTPLRGDDGAPNWDLLAAEGAREIVARLRVPARDAAHGEALARAADAMEELATRVEPARVAWRLRLVRMPSQPGRVRATGPGLAEVEVKVPEGASETVVRLPLTAGERREIADMPDRSALALEIGLAYAATWKPREAEKAVEHGRRVGFALTPMVIAAAATPAEGLAALEDAVRLHQESGWRESGFEPAWGHARVTKPLLAKALREAPVSEVAASKEITVLLDARLAWLGPVATLRTLAKRPADLKKELADLLGRMGAGGGMASDPSETRMLVATASGRSAPRASLDPWTDLAPPERDALVGRCATALGKVAAALEMPKGTMATLRTGESGAIEGDAPDAASLKSGVAWIRVPLFGAARDGLAPASK